MTLSNSKLVQNFYNGDTKGKSSSISIKGDTLYSYSAPIAIRLDTHFIISNKCRDLFGTPYSKTTSSHIYRCFVTLTPNKLVDGWADKDKKQFNKHKTYVILNSMLKEFSTLYTPTFELIHKKQNLKIINNKLILNNNIVLVTKQSNYDCYYTKRIELGKNHECSSCPNRFKCITMINYDYGNSAMVFTFHKELAQYPEIEKACKKVLKNI